MLDRLLKKSSTALIKLLSVSSEIVEFFNKLLRLDVDII